jgi:hypothetical protein
MVIVSMSMLIAGVDGSVAAASGRRNDRANGQTREGRVLKGASAEGVEC